MCGRFALHSPASLLVDRFAATVHGDAPEPRYNAAPMQNLPVVRFNPDTRERRLSPLRWGLVPVWSKDPSGAAKMINARAEGVAERPAFRSAFKKRRCLVPFDAYYEWRKVDGAKIPHAIATDSNGPDAFAGLWEGWKDPANGEWLHTFTIITTEANDATRAIHDRMPVILPPARWSAWLGEEEASPGELQAMLVPYPSAHMRVWRVSKDVGSVKNDRPDLIDAVDSGPAINPA
ncbi:SOS response-associated peptidase [Azospirillum canadense]|uniref:SOS response-associated peptidase n=1 Tax=Azospirillum canadense TaxID=403962 RepID=UPI002227F6ED|nr:SOS response-associated peptidase [Azospirillum canadense]